LRIIAIMVRFSSWLVLALLLYKADFKSTSTDGILTPTDLESLWADLGSNDGVKAYQAIVAMENDPQRVVPFMAKHLRPITKVEPQRISRLIVDLDNNRFSVREEAQRELEELVSLAEKQLRRTLASRPSVEARRRIETLLDRLDPVKNPARLQTLRAVEVLEHIGTPEAQRVLKSLSQGAPEARLTQESKAATERLDRRSARDQN
jgi:hypothetical protein